MMFPKEFIERIKDKITISEIVRKKVMLKSKGASEHSGLCPFHNEKTPSFTVSDDKGFFHCFGCGAHGNIFDFLMRTEGLSFPDAVERLALEANLPLPETDEKYRQIEDKSRKLMACAEAACKWFQSNLKISIGAIARDYLKSRAISEQIIEEFRLGYCPEERGGLEKYLVSQGFTLQQMQDIGLIKNGWEYFRGRLIFPIMSGKGEVIAFGGRILGKGEPKYLNSPETPIFQKRRTLYGKGTARKPAFESGEIIVTEGYMDTIALNQAGFRNVVAPLGTSLTEEHMAELWRMAKTPTICLDGDSAGRRAGIRAAMLAVPLLKTGLSLKFVELPDGKDPDDIVKQSPKLFTDLLKTAKPLSDIIYEAEKEKTPLTTPEQQADLRARLIQIASKIPDRDISRNYQSYFDQKLWNDKKVLGRNIKQAIPISVAKTMGKRADKEKMLSLELGFLGIISVAPELLDLPEIEEEFVNLEFSEQEIDNLRQNILSSRTLEGEKWQSMVINLIGELNKKYLHFVKLGEEFAKKANSPHAAWNKYLEEFYGHMVASEHEEMEVTDDEASFLRIQKSHNQLIETQEKINASQAE